jgi:hypothetical protein
MPKPGNSWVKVFNHEKKVTSNQKIQMTVISREYPETDR